MRQDRGRRDFRQSYAPVKVGDELDVKIEAVGEKGDGIAKKDGFVLFVPGAKQGDNVRIKVTRVLAKVGFAEVVGQSEKAESEESQESNEEVDASPEEAGSEDQYSSQDSENFGEENQ